jgi:hypothetical protein
MPGGPSVRAWGRAVVFVLFVSIPFLASAEESTDKVSVEKIQVLKISPQDESAVVKVPGGKFQMIKVGDPLGDKGGKVVEIVEGRVVIEEGSGRNAETIIIRIGKGEQRIERLRKDPGEKPLLFAPKQDETEKGQRIEGGSFSTKRK